MRSSYTMQAALRFIAEGFAHAGLSFYGCPGVLSEGGVCWGMPPDSSDETKEERLAAAPPRCGGAEAIPVITEFEVAGATAAAKGGRECINLTRNAGDHHWATTAVRAVSLNRSWGPIWLSTDTVLETRQDANDVR